MGSRCGNSTETGARTLYQTLHVVDVRVEAVRFALQSPHFVNVRCCQCTCWTWTRTERTERTELWLCMRIRLVWETRGRTQCGGRDSGVDKRVRARLAPTRRRSCRSRGHWRQRARIEVRRWHCRGCRGCQGVDSLVETQQRLGQLTLNR